MATKRSDTAQDICQLKVTLLGTKPPIWRRLLVPTAITLAQLHDVLQIAMGWQNCHMHKFRIGRRYFGRPSPEEQLMGVAPTEDERKGTLSALLGKTGAKLTYTYDMGDSWEHSIVLEKGNPADPGAQYPACIGGQFACPPEDCGGIPGYYHLLEAIEDRNHPQHDELYEWVGEHYDPRDFSLDKVNRRLSRTSRSRKSRQH